MTTKERRNEITRLAAQEASQKQNTEDLARIYQGLEQDIDETKARQDAVEKELRSRYLAELPQHTKVRIKGGVDKGKIAFIRGIQGINAEGRPIWTLWRSKKDGTPSSFRMASSYHTQDLERER